MHVICMYNPMLVWLPYTPSSDRNSINVALKHECCYCYFPVVTLKNCNTNDSHCSVMVMDQYAQTIIISQITDMTADTGLTS